MSKDQQAISLAGAVFTIIGFVIGISIFILPGQIAASTGPGVIFSYLIAGIAALFSCLVAAQIGSIVPKSGAGFLSVAAFLSPFWGFMMVWLMLGGASLAVAFLGYGFADYLEPMFPGLDRQYVAVAVILAFGMVNLLGATTAVWLQSFMVILLLLVLAVFSCVGIINLEPKNLDPFLPNGWGPVWQSAVPAFFSFAGFMMIIELGGEIKNAKENVPRALLYSFLVVIGFYVSVSLALVGVVPWQELNAVNAPVALVATRLFPEYITTIILLCALMAAATSINGMVLGYSRYMVPLAKTCLIPQVLGLQSKRNHTPIFGVLFMVILAEIWAFMETTVVDLATGIVVALMGTQVLIGCALFGYRRKQRIRPGEQGFALGKIGTYIFAGGLIIISFSFMITGLVSDNQTIPIVIYYSIAGVAAYEIRMRILGGRKRQVGELVEVEINSVDK